MIPLPHNILKNIKLHFKMIEKNIMKKGNGDTFSITKILAKDR